MQPSSPTFTRLSQTSPFQLPEHLTAATLVLVNKPDTHFYPVFHVQKDPPPDLSGVDTQGKQITPFDQIVIGSEIDSDLRMFFAEPKHCSLIIDSLGKLYILNFSSANPCQLNETTLLVNTLHTLEHLDHIHVAGKDFRVEYKPGYPISSEAVPDGNEPDLAFFDSSNPQVGELEDLDNSSEHYLECIQPQNFADSPKIYETPGKDSVSKTPQSPPKRYVTHSSPAKSSTPAPPRRSATPRSASSRKAATQHDATDNSCTSMEVNTSQPSLVPRDISTVDTPLEPRRRLSELPKKALSSPVKLKRKSAPATQLRISSRLLHLTLDSTADSPTPRRPSRTNGSPAATSAKKMHKESQNPSATFYKSPHNTGPLPRRSKSPPTISNRKSVRFGPSLSPEEFCRHLPPSTPVKRGSTPRSATKAVLRRSTPYKPRPSASKSKSTSPNTFSPKLSPKLFTPKTPRIIPKLSPVEETRAAGLTTKSTTREPKLRKGFGKGILAEMAESQTLKVSSRISTPTSIHSKLPNTFSDPIVGNISLKRQTKISSLASQNFSQQNEQSLLDIAPRNKSKSPEPLSNTKRKSASSIDKPGRMESPLLRHSHRLGASPPPAQDTPLHRSDPPLNLNSPNFTIPAAIDFANSPNASVQMTPSTTRYSKTPESASRDKQTGKRNNSPSEPLRMSRRVSKSPDTYQSPPIAATKHVVVTSSSSTGKVYKLRDSTSPVVQNIPQSVPKRSPAALRNSPADTKRKSDVKSPAVPNNSPVIEKNPPSALKKSSLVNTTKSPAVPKRTQADPKSPSFLTKSPIVPNKSPADFKQSPVILTKSPAVQIPCTQSSSTPARRSSARRSTQRVQIFRSEISPDFERSIVHEPSPTPTPKQRPSTPRSRSSTPSTNLSFHKPATPRSTTSSSSPLPVICSPRRGRSEGSQVLELAWVSPTRNHPTTPRSTNKPPSSVKMERVATPRPPSRRSVRKEDLFNPKLFKTPKNRNRTSQPETNFTPSLFNISESPGVSKRSSSAPHDTPSPKARRSKRSVSLPGEREPRVRHTAIPEDAFCPYIFRTPKTKQVNTTSKPEDNCMPALFKSPLTPVRSEARGVKRPASQHKTPSKARKPESCESPEVSPLVVRETRSKKPQVEKPREPNKRVVNKEAPSSPAKVVLVTSPPRAQETSPFVIKTNIKILSPSSPPVRMTRNRTSKRTKPLKSPVALQKSKVVKSPKTPSPVKETPPVESEIIEVESSPSPPPIRFLRQRKASTKPVPLKAKKDPKPMEAPEVTKSVPSPIQRVLQGDKQTISQTQTETIGILKPNLKRQAPPVSKRKVTLAISPMASKLSSPKRTRNKVGQTKAKVHSPTQPEISSYSLRNERSTRASRAK